MTAGPCDVKMGAKRSVYANRYTKNDSREDPMNKNFYRRCCRMIMLLACVLLLCGCGQAATVVSQAPVPAVTPVPITPAPCNHSFSDGICLQCGMPCGHEWWEGACTMCGIRCAHRFSLAGSCTVCGTACPHYTVNEGICAECGWVCTHPQHDSVSAACLYCGAHCRHAFVEEVCACGRTAHINTEWLPEEMHWDVPEKGSVEIYPYPTQDYIGEGVYGLTDLWGEKQCAVYLPYGYTEGKPYNVLFLAHGAGGDEADWLLREHWFEDEEMGVPKMLDAMIYYGYCEPLIVVATSSSTLSGVNNEAGITVWLQLYPELRNDLLPVIVDTYSTYATDSSYISLVTARDHFAFAGLSDGALVTQYAAMMNAFDFFSWFGLYSGNDSMDLVMSALHNQWSEFPLNYFFTAAGEFDFQRNNVETQYAKFCEGSYKVTDGVNGRLAIIQGYKHEWPVWYISLYDTLLLFFK